MTTDKDKILEQERIRQEREMETKIRESVRPFGKIVKHDDLVIEEVKQQIRFGSEMMDEIAKTDRSTHKKIGLTEKDIRILIICFFIVMAGIVIKFKYTDDAIEANRLKANETFQAMQKEITALRQEMSAYKDELLVYKKERDLCASDVHCPGFLFFKYIQESYQKWKDMHDQAPVITLEDFHDAGKFHHVRSAGGGIQYF